MRITPGVSEAFEFVFGNQDGVPLNLLLMRAKLVFWVMQDMDIDDMTLAQSKILLAQEIEIQEPYAGRLFTILNAEETQTIARESTSFVRWGMFLINEDGDVFPTEVNRNGGRAGTVRLDLASGIPVAEVIRTA